MTSGSVKICSSLRQEFTQIEEWKSDTVAVVLLYRDVKDKYA